MQFHPGVYRPLEQRLAAQFRSVVANNDFLMPGILPAAACVIIDHVDNLETMTVHQLTADEFQRPASGLEAGKDKEKGRLPVPDIWHR